VTGEVFFCGGVVMIRLIFLFGILCASLPVSADDYAKEQSYFDQTLKLIGLLKSNTTDNSFTELYCCWAGEYSEPIEKFKTINISQVKFENHFEIELREKVKFIRQ
jgi:methionine synthase II (cobalamin-independent)